MLLCEDLGYSVIRAVQCDERVCSVLNVYHSYQSKREWRFISTKDEWAPSFIQLCHHHRTVISALCSFALCRFSTSILLLFSPIRLLFVFFFIIFHSPTQDFKVHFINGSKVVNFHLLNANAELVLFKFIRSISTIQYSFI